MRRFDVISPLLGRDELVAQLARRIAAAAAGQGGFLGIVAEAGAGKTRLVEEVCGHGASTSTFLYGRAFQATATTPYAVWVDALEPHLSALSRRELFHVLANESDLIRLFPGCSQVSEHRLTEPVGYLGSEQTRLFGQMAAMLARMARDKPLVLILDNLHWADTSSIELLHFAARAAKDSKLLLVGLYRAEQVSNDASLSICVDSLRRLGLADVLTIPPLSIEATAQLLAHETKQAWAVEDVEKLHRLTQGNALFVGELGKHAVSRGRDELYTWNSSDELPSSIQSLLIGRFRALNEDCRRILAFASSFEVPIQYELLVSLTGYAEERLLDALDTLSGQRLLAEVVTGNDVAYAFQKPLFQTIVYLGMGLARRQFLHRIIAAEMIRKGSGDAATVARHLISGAAPDQQHDALPYLMQASKKAVGMFGNHEAIALLTTALQIAKSDGGTRHLLADIYLDLGESCKRLGRFTDAINFWTEALPTSNDRVAARIRRSIARTLWQAGQESDAKRELEDGVAALEGAGLSEEGLFLRQEHALNLARQGRTVDALNAASAALTLAGGESHMELAARIYNVICLSHGYNGDRRQAALASQKAIGLSEHLPYPGAAFLAHYTMGALLRYEGALTSFEHHCGACTRIAQQMHSVALESWPLSIKVERYALEGRILEAIQFGERAIALDETTGQGAVLPRTHAFLAVALRMAGDLLRSRHHFEQSQRMVSHRVTTEIRVVAVQICSEAFLAFHDGRYEDVIGLVEKLERHFPPKETLAFYALHPYALPLAAEAAARLARPAEAKALLARIAGLRHRGAKQEDGTSLLVTGLIHAQEGRLEESIHCLQLAANCWDSHQRPFDAGRTRVELANVFERQGQMARCVEVLDAAGALFIKMGAQREAAVVGQRLRKLGQRPSFGSTHKLVGQPISRRESEVVAWISQGKSNKEIAAQLFLSELTIETHVKNILRKLGLKSRAQVAVYGASGELNTAWPERSPRSARHEPAGRRA